MAHDPSTKAAVIAALMSGQGVTEVANQYKLDKSVVSRWRSSLPEVMQRNATEKKVRDFGEMIGNYLEKSLDTLAKQQEHFSDPKWLMRQNAADLAVLHGVTADKCIRLFEAAQMNHGDQ